MMRRHMICALVTVVQTCALPISPRMVPPRIAAERRFAEPIASTPHAMGVLAELAGEAIAAKAKRGRGARQFRATFFRSDGLARTIAVETGAPTRDAALAMRLFAERIDALRDPIDPGFDRKSTRLNSSH